MKTMFRLLLVGMLCMTVAGVLASGDDRPSDVSQLPRAAQMFIKHHFPSERVRSVTEEHDWTSTTYEVRFESGGSLDFDRSGAWQEVDCGRMAVPASVVPRRIADYVKRHYGEGAFVTEIGRGRRNYGVTLSNGHELTFDRQFRLMQIDD